MIRGLNLAINSREFAGLPEDEEGNVAPDERATEDANIDRARAALRKKQARLSTLQGKATPSSSRGGVGNSPQRRTRAAASDSEEGSPSADQAAGSSW